jgi:biopolymer transport protein ExbD
MEIRAMRHAVLILALLAAACGDGGSGGNDSRYANLGAPAFSEQRGAAATVVLAASGQGNCSARWDGQPATVQQVLERSSALVDRVIGGGGNVTSVTEGSIVALVAPANLPFACADTFLAPVRRSGVASVLLQPEGGEPALADFTLSDIGAPPPSVVLTIGAGGQLQWNGEAITIEAIPDRMRRLGGGGATEIEAPPGELELRPAREATVGQVHAVLRAIRENHVRAALLLPSVQPSRPPAPAPAPAAGNQAAPATGNQAAPAPRR